jgi:hypothetical protein
MAQSRTKQDPAALAGFGFPLVVTLLRAGTLAAGASTELDAFSVPLSWSKNRKGAAFTLTELFVFLGNKGGASGQTTVKLIKNGDTTNGVLATVNIAYNATNPYAAVDLRDRFGDGMALKPGDRIGLYVTAVPGTASADVSARVSGEAYGVEEG